jgi:D-alanyl-D-alanine carboxypeptidase (penicillin-binding protein 5/6)
MRSAALLMVLVLHVTGVWNHVSATTQASLIAHATAAPSTILAAGNVDSTPVPNFIPSPLPLRLSDSTPPSFSAASVVAIDRATGTVLFAKDAGVTRPIASVTKMVTALVIMSRHKLTETITVPNLPAYPVEAETLGLTPGDTYPLENMLEAALVPSANDAADSLAIMDAGSVTKFAARMNLKMTEWGIQGTHFSSASGLEDTNNYASAFALAKIATLVLQNPDLARIVSYQNVSFSSGNGRNFNLKSTNELLASGGFYGIKTGYTQAAGECFVGLTRINGHDVVTVVLGANNRFTATTDVRNWINRAYHWL